MAEYGASDEWVALPASLVLELQARASRCGTTVRDVISKGLQAIGDSSSGADEAGDSRPAEPLIDGFPSYLERTSAFLTPTSAPDSRMAGYSSTPQGQESQQRCVQRRLSREQSPSLPDLSLSDSAYLENDTLLSLVLSRLSPHSSSLAAARLVSKQWARHGMAAVEELRLNQRDGFALRMPASASDPEPQTRFFSLPDGWAGRLPGLRRLEIQDDSGCWKHASAKLIWGLQTLTNLTTLKVASLEQPASVSMSAHGALPLEWRTERLVELAGTHLRSLSTLDLLDSPSVLFMDGPARQSTLDALQQLTALRTLALAVSPSSLAALARALPSTLRSFSVAVYANHDSDIEAAASGLRELPQDCSSVELNLHHFRGRPLDQEPPDSRISSAGLAALASVPPRLTKLGMQLENVAPEAILEGLWKGLVGQTSLTSLCLDGVSIMHDEVDALKTTFSNLSHLTSLTHLELPLSFPDLFGETPLRPASSLAVFQHFTHLRSLSLVGQEHVPDDALASLLEPLGNLTSLDLSAVSSLGYAGLYTLGSMSGLTHLNLVSLGELHEFNLMSELTSGLSHLTGLCVLDLRENPSLSLSDLAHLKSLTALEHLGLGRYFTQALDMGTMHSRDVSKDSFYKVLLDKLDDDDDIGKFADELEDLRDIFPLLAGASSSDSGMRHILESIVAEAVPNEGCGGGLAEAMPRHLRQKEYFHCGSSGPSCHLRSKWYEGPGN